MKLLPFLFLLVACHASPCGTKSDFLNHFSDFTVSVQKESLPYQDAKWADHDLTFKEYVKDCYRQYAKDLSTTEKSQFWGEVLHYYYLRYGKGMFTQLMDDNNQLSAEVRSQLKQIWGSTEIALLYLFQHLDDYLTGEQIEAVLNLGKEAMKQL